ncbi:MAG: hypothetical protein Q9166_002120 [cf. Caloplaca sp. 2 TL-2023]
MRFRGQYRPDSHFAKALIKANLTMVQMVKHSKPQVKGEHLTFFLQYSVVLLVVVIGIMFWLDSRIEDYPNEARPIPEEFEDWLLAEETLDENTPLLASSSKNVKEGPLSPDEVRRLTDLIRADERSGYGTIVGRKRKAEAVSEGLEGERWGSPRTRKLKIETSFAADGSWVGDQVYTSPSPIGGDDVSDRSGDCKVLFTFRAPYPGRVIKSR